MAGDTARLNGIQTRFGSSAACLREPISVVSNDDDVDLQWIGWARFTVTVQADEVARHLLPTEIGKLQGLPTGSFNVPLARISDQLRGRHRRH